MNVRSNLSYTPERLSEPRDGSEIDLAGLFDIVFSRRRLLAPALALSFAVAYGYIAFAPVRYTASMSIMIDPRDRIPAGVEAQPMPQNPDPALVESQMQLLTSKAVLRRLIESQNLLNASDEHPTLLLSALAPLFKLLEDGSSGSIDPADKLSEALAKEISTKRGERSYVVDVDVMARTREEAVKRANGLFEAYIAEQAKLRDEITLKQTAFLDGRVDDLRERVERAERKVQDYREANALAVLDGRTSPEQQLGGANTALVAARNKVSEIEARYQQLRTALQQPNFAGADNEALRSPLIERLRQDYASLLRDEAYARTVLGPRHPTYLTTQAQLDATKLQIKAEIQRIFLSIERELRAAQAEAVAAEKLVTNTETLSNKLNDHVRELTDLEREAATLRVTYEKALTARENVRRDVVDSPLSVLMDAPVAGSSRTSPKTLAALILALAAAINIWIVMALIAEARQRRSSNPSPGGEAKTKWGFPSIPPVPAWLSPRSASEKRPLYAASGEEKDANKLSSAPIQAQGFLCRGPWPSNLSNSFDRANANYPNLSVTKAIALAVGVEPTFAKSVQIVLDWSMGLSSNLGRTPRIVLSSVDADPAVATLALAVARRARLQGLRALIVDCEGADSLLAQFADEQKRARASRLEDRGRDSISGGEIVIAKRANRPSMKRALADPSSFDLVLLACGSFQVASDAIGHQQLADAIVAVGRGSAIPHELNAAMSALNLPWDNCGIVLFSASVPGESLACA